MEDPAGFLLILAVFAFCVWLYILVPIRMARARKRRPWLWVLVSLFVSPFVAIIALWLVGEKKS